MRRKAADTIAIAIEEEIISGRFEVGMPLGTESELCARFGVSRWALREAIAIVQNDGLIVVRRGRGGGAVVNSAPERSLAAAVCGFLLYARLDIDQLIDARMVVDRLLYWFAARSVGREITPEALALLAEDPRMDTRSAAEAILDQILAMSGNPFVAMFGLALSKLMSCRLALAGEVGVPADAAVSNRLLALRRRQLDSIVGVDENIAIAAAVEIAGLWRALFVANTSDLTVPSNADGREIAERLAVVLHPGQDLRGAGMVAALLMIDAIEARTTPGGLIGSEAKLTERYGVPRNILREGIRILERDGFVRAESGRHGGIRVGEPDMTALVDRAARTFAFLHVMPRDVDALSQELRMAAVAFAITAANRDGTSLFRLAEDIRAMRGSARHDWRDAAFLMLAERSANDFLVLFERICLRLAKDVFGEREMPYDKDLLEYLACSIESGNISLSRRYVAEIHREWMAGLS